MTLLAPYVDAGLLLIAPAMPLIRRKVRPNAWYGFRVRETRTDPDTWYAANAYAGRYLLGVGVVAILSAVGFHSTPGIILAALAVCVLRSFRYLALLARGFDTTL